MCDEMFYLNIFENIDVEGIYNKVCCLEINYYD